MTTSSQIKAKAKETLKNNWIYCIICGCILTFLTLICFVLAELFLNIFGSFIVEILILFLAFTVISPVFLGALRMFWAILNGETVNPTDIFYYFYSAKYYFKSVKVFFYMFLKVIPIGIIFHIPAAVVWLISQNFIFEFLNMATPLWTSNLQYIGDFLFFAASVATYVFSFRYYMAPMLIVADENMVPLEAINMSSVISKRSGFEFVSLIFSLFGWLVLCLSIMPAPFVLPYLIMCYVIHVHFSINEYNEYVEQSMQNEFPTFTVGVLYDE